MPPLGQPKKKKAADGQRQLVTQVSPMLRQAVKTIVAARIAVEPKLGLEKPSQLLMMLSVQQLVRWIPGPSLIAPSKRRDCMVCKVVSRALAFDEPPGRHGAAS